MVQPAGPSSLVRVGVLGGSFDPIHIGHLALAERVAECLGLTQVLFLPCRQPPHKAHRQLAPAEDRYAMVLLATRDNPRFAVSRLELDRSGPSYTLDTVRALRAQWGAGSDIRLIVGADQMLEVPTWHRAPELLAEARFVAVPRPGYDLGQLAARLGAWVAQVQVLPMPELDVSASDLRRRVAAGQSIRYLTPEPVREYILSRGLYRTPAAGRDEHLPCDA